MSNWVKSEHIGIFNKYLHFEVSNGEIIKFNIRFNLNDNFFNNKEIIKLESNNICQLNEMSISCVKQFILDYCESKGYTIDLLPIDWFDTTDWHDTTYTYDLTKVFYCIDYSLSISTNNHINYSLSREYNEYSVKLDNYTGLQQAKEGAANFLRELVDNFNKCIKDIGE